MNVSIPEGAIEGGRSARKQWLRSWFQYPKVRLKELDCLAEQPGGVGFQYPKVRLKDLLCNVYSP